MHSIILFLILVSLTVEHAARSQWIPGAFGYLQEVIAIIIAVYVISVGVRTRFKFVNPSYWLVFGALAVTMACGIIVNSEEPGPLFAGLRTYLRAMPLFFLPAVLLINEKQLRTQFMVILGIALLQFPVAMWQRLIVHSENRTSGDSVVGTLVNSSYLTVYCICVASVLVALYMRKRLSAAWFFPLLLLVLAPTTINETKSTVFLLPIAFLVTFVLGAARGTRFRNSILAVCVLGVFAAIFIPVYDYYIKPRWGYGIVEFMTMQGRLEGYLEKDTGLGTRKEAGRVDAIVVPLKELAKQPAQLAFGVGIGNASRSSLGLQFWGEYFRRYEPFVVQSTGALVLLETGLIGSFLLLFLYYLLFRDSRIVAKRDRGLHGALALGWAGCVVVITLTTYYKEIVASGALSYMFWYFSGVVAAQRMRLALASAPVPPVVRSSVAAV